MFGACSTGGGIRFPRTSTFRITAVRRVFAGNKAGVAVRGEVIHFVSVHGDGDDFVPLVVGVAVVVIEGDRSSEDESARQIVGRGVQDGMGCGRRPFHDLIERVHRSAAWW